MAWIDAMIPAIQRQQEEIFAMTWGHLAPKKNHTYRGHIVWALDLYDCGYLNPKVLECELPGLSDSPWFYDAMIDSLQKIHDEMFSDHRKTFWGPSNREIATAGTIWRWEGTFRNYTFKGKVRQLHCEGLGKPVAITVNRNLTKKDFVKIAAEIRALPSKKRKEKIAQILPELRGSNPKFNENMFLIACNA